MSRGVLQGCANRLAGVGPGSRKSPVEGRSARRRLRAAPAAAAAGAGAWAGAGTANAGRTESRARASRPARPTDHERLLLWEQPRRRAERAEPLSPSRRAQAPRGEVSLRRVSRGRAAPLGAPRPPPPLAGQTGKFVGELQATTSGK